MNAAYGHPRNAAWRVCATALLCAAVGVPAQTIHKLTDADGHITFTDQPDWTPRTRGAPDSDVVSALATSSPMTSKSAASIDSNEAKRRLLRAQQIRRNAQAPSPGVNFDVVDVTLMNERYLRGQGRLDREVVAAQRRSNKASSIRNVVPGSGSKTEPLKLAQP
ncbi:MAG TPA: DUF4124 domain-containing protein [Burkholderiales bacterium]